MQPKWDCISSREVARVALGSMMRNLSRWYWRSEIANPLQPIGIGIAINCKLHWNWIYSPYKYAWTFVIFNLTDAWLQVSELWPDPIDGAKCQLSLADLRDKNFRQSCTVLTDTVRVYRISGWDNIWLRQASGVTKIHPSHISNDQMRSDVTQTDRADIMWPLPKLFVSIWPQFVWLALIIERWF